MSGRGGGGVASNGKGNTGISGIPAGSRKMVQSLKEIVNNCTEQEIYAMLKDCNMDPNEAVNRLLAQGPPPISLSKSFTLSKFIFLIFEFDDLGFFFTFFRENQKIRIGLRHSCSITVLETVQWVSGLLRENIYWVE